MLNHYLTEHAACCFYGAETLGEKLWLMLSSYPENRPTSDFEANFWHIFQEDFYLILVEAIDARHPKEFRLTDVRQIIGSVCNGDLFLTSALPWLDRLGEELLQRNGDLLCYREAKVESYVRLAATMDPTLLVAWHLSDWLLHNGESAPHNIRRVLSAQTPFFAPPGNPWQPFAEGHVHFWGVTADNSILESYLLSKHSIKSFSHATTWQREQSNKLSLLLLRARSLLAMLLTALDPPDKSPQQQSARSDDSTQHSRNWVHKLASLGNSMLEDQQLPDWPTLMSMHTSASTGSADWTLGELANSMASKSTHSWLWLQLYLCRRYQTNETHPLERVAILCFWQSVNALRQSLIMDGQGLTRFAERYYNNPLGRDSEAFNDNVRRIFSGKEDVAEIKSGLNSFTPKFSRNLSNALLGLIGASPLSAPYIFGEHETTLDSRAKDYIKTLERWHFCGHFSRSSGQRKLGVRAKPDSKSLWKNAEKLLKSLNMQTGWNQAAFLGGKLSSQFHFQPSHWFRGLDVAGDENGLRIECFAPILRWLRSGFMSRSEGARAGSGFHLSIHAGEDYAHPASGMRHIDETVIFCEMRDGDRLGHALALGIEPTVWAERQGEMLLPLDEHLDNLVWLWHYATLLSGRLPLAQQVLPILERRITRMYRESGWSYTPEFGQEFEKDKPKTSISTVVMELANAGPDTLYRAWILRRNCNYRLQQLFDSPPLSTQEKVSLPDWTCIADSNDLASQIYLSRHSHLNNGIEPALVIVRTGTGRFVRNDLGPEHRKTSGYRAQSGRNVDLIEDVETPAELEFMHALQDYLLDHYDSMGLIIETNPTSNVSIARLKGHSEHPIFRWSPPDEAVLVKGAEANRYGLRRGPVRVLVNTDDPGIMPTTLRTEFLLLREAALTRGVSRTVAERWLETLRLYGIEQFHRNHLTVFEPL
jgi:hypothetical protein